MHSYLLGLHQHIYDLSSYFLYLVEMATWFNQDKYAHAKGKKNEPLSKLISPLKKKKTTNGSGVVILTPIQPSLPSSPIMSLRELPLPPMTRAKRKEKMGQSVWADPTTAFGRAYKVITEDKLRALSSILAHKLVSCHIHKMLQVRLFFIFYFCFWNVVLLLFLWVFSSLLFRFLGSRCIWRLIISRLGRR